MCVLANQLNVKNKNAFIKANNHLKVIYSDRAGPIDPIGKDGFKYILNFVEDYSGCTCYFYRLWCRIIFLVSLMIY